MALKEAQDFCDQQIIIDEIIKEAEHETDPIRQAQLYDYAAY